MAAIRKARIQKLLPQAMERADLDAWVVICLENNNDPLAIRISGENAAGTAAFMFFLKDGRMTSVAISPVGEATALKRRCVARYSDRDRAWGIVWEAIARELGRGDPKKMGTTLRVD